MQTAVLQEYKLGDMVARYLIDPDSSQVGFQLLPADLPVTDEQTASFAVESLVQLKLTGDIYNEAYAGGCSMRTR